MSRRRRETPLKRVNPSGKVVWVARYTGLDGKRRFAGTRDRQYEAQTLIDEAYEAEARVAPETVGAYFATWSDRYPRSPRTNRTNNGRIRQVLDVEFDGRQLRDWPFGDLRRRHAHDLVAHMLTTQGRAVVGAQNILRALSAMAEDAITDEIADVNFVRGVKVRANDPRATRQSRQPRILTFEQMHQLAAAAGEREPMIRVLADCGLRIGELLGLERTDFDGTTFHVRGSAHEGVFTPGDQATKKHVRDVPCPPSTAQLVRSMPTRIDTSLLFPTPTGRLWWERNFYRDVWEPARDASGVDAAPHDFRHSWVTHMRAARIDEADVAAVAGHSLATAARYTHPLHRSHDAIREVVG